ncbi:hypothetical protein U1Q18_018546 [Sarracenia purpurea var. burkii]
MAAIEEAQLDVLRQYELRLLRCSIPASLPASYEPSDDFDAVQRRPLPSLNALIKDVIASIETGNYVEALSSDAARTIFKFQDSSLSPSVYSPEWFYSELVPHCVENFLFDNSEDERDRCYKEFLLMAIAVAAFLAFIQCNITGPFERLPYLPLPAFEHGSGGIGGAKWEGWARNHLMAAGSDLLGKFSNLQDFTQSSVHVAIFSVAVIKMK